MTEPLHMPSSTLADASYDYQRRWATVRRILPRPVRRALRLGYLLMLDGADLCLGRNKDLVPPRWLNPIGDGDFEGTGEEFLNYFIRFGGLQPTHDILDVGCGIGRMARPFTKYLTTGTYEGFDIVPTGIRWCQKHFTPRFPAFQFTFADIRNPEYNPNGTVTAAQYRFPYPDSHFDFAFLTSVFTHMLPQDVNHYLSELRRVFKPMGKCLATFFILNRESRQFMASGKSSLNFQYDLPGCWTTNPELPEAAIGYEEQVLTSLLHANGLALDSIHYGRWCGRNVYLSYQDVVVIKNL